MQAAYEPVGHAVVDLLTPADVQRLLGELATLKPDDNFLPRHHSGEGLTYHCSFLDANHDYRRNVHALITRYFANHIARMLEGFEILISNFYIKPPHYGAMAIHQNWPTIADIEDTTVTVWCPLVDVVEGNGALQVVSGSHKLLPHIEGPNSPCYFAKFRQALLGKYFTPFTLRAGDAVVFDDGLVHWSANNNSDTPRIAIQVICRPVDSVPVYWFFDPLYPERFELIEADSDFWLTTDAKDLRTRQPHWKSLGFTPNRNRQITEQEFATLLADGERIRGELSQRWKPAGIRR